MDVLAANRQAKMEAKKMNEINAAEAKAANEEIMRHNHTPQKIRMPLDFVVYDRNNDDLIDMEEFKMRANTETPEPFFAAHDANRDGFLNIEEFNHMVKADDVVIKKSMPYEG